MFSKIHEDCGIFGIKERCRNNVAALTYYALYALQHRGQESCGIAVNDRGIIKSHRGVGLVSDVFDERTLSSLGEGTMAVGHTRYSMTGSVSAVNAQPLMVRHVKGALALAHNGNISNAAVLRRELELNGAIFHTTNDSEVIAYLIIRARLVESSIELAIASAMNRLEGAYSLVIMSPRKLIAVRDPHGFRPLCIGETADGGVLFASESCALDTLDARFVRDVNPGEIVVADEAGIRSINTHCNKVSPALCVFEFIYFARPDSILDGASVHAARKKAGSLLWQEHPRDADVVIGVPDSGLDAAMGYAEASGIPYGIGFVKNRYVGRTFIQPESGHRDDIIRIKLNTLGETVKGKRVVLVDDSIVRGTTSVNIVNLLRRSGATQVHMLVSSPPFINPCYFGTDIDSRENLIACKMTIEEIGRSIGVDSLGYLSVESIKKVADTNLGSFCTACFSGDYPVAPPEELPADTYRFELPIENGGGEI
jgi:amidophosphoribosyltransferase